MNSRQQQLIETLCASPGPEDGIDPRRSRRAWQHLDAKNYHQEQLCRQVERAMCMALSESGSPVLTILEVLHVRPVPQNNSLWVTVTPTPSDMEVACDWRTIQEALQRARGLLRTIVAAALTRKRVPELLFRIEGCKENIHSHFNT